MNDQPAEALPHDADVKIVHITDLHVGRQFNEDRWNDFSDLCVTLKPDLVVVSGDLVDNPFRWTLRRARRKLYDLRDRVSRAKSDAANPAACHLIVIPGNHDTRITGLIPRTRRGPLLGLEALLLLGLGVTSYILNSLGVVIVGALILLGFNVLLVSLFGHFRAYFPPLEAITQPMRLPLGPTVVEIYPFDSASHPIILAGGEIPAAQFVSSRRTPTAQDSIDGSPYRIAVVHHHPLPIPYDNPLEETMILRNAGAFLSELARLRVRLILHGHKHHWNFARIAVNAEQPEPHEMGVLAGTTLTRGRIKADGDAGYGFNLLTLDPHGSMKVTPYVSRGGTFVASPDFFVEDVVTCNRRLQWFARERHGVECRIVHSITKVSQDGDATQRVEYRGFQVVKDGWECDAMPEGMQAVVTHGHIELFEAGPLGESGPRQLHLRRTVDEVRQQGGQITFGRRVYANENPFDYFFQYYAINSLAMSAQQFALMHPEKAGPAIEATSFMTPVFPCRELRMTVIFPKGFRIEGLPELVVTDQHGRRCNLLERHCRDTDALQFDSANNSIRLSVVAPPPLGRFRVLWRLTSDGPPEGRPVKSLQGRVKELALRLLEVRRDDAVAADESTWRRLRDLVTVLENSVREHFKLDPPDRDPLDIYIMAYDPAENRLRVVVGNFPEGNKVWKLRLAYGDGIAGRAYKMNKIRLFVKAKAEETGTPYYYYPFEGKLAKGSIKEEVVLSIPLTHPKDPEAVYAILNCSSQRPASKLVDLDEGEVAGERLVAINEFCFQALSALFWPNCC